MTIGEKLTRRQKLILTVTALAIIASVFTAQLSRAQSPAQIGSSSPLAVFVTNTPALPEGFTAGCMFAMHGSQKLFGVPGGVPVAPVSLMGLAGIIEFFGGLLIAIGFMTGIVAIITSGQMAAAYFMAHAPQGPLPLLNRGELAVVYCFLFLYMAAHGSGIWSVDSARRR